MQNAVDKILNEFVNGTYDILGDRVKKIILYGSYARGDYSNESDIDIMILTDLSDGEIVEYRTILSDFAFDLEWDSDCKIMFSPIIKNIDKFNYWVDTMPFYINIQNEGVVLHG